MQIIGSALFYKKYELKGREEVASKAMQVDHDSAPLLAFIFFSSFS
jgi:hypothetical protein